uniref:Cytochrome P450 n=1 Tax=Daucus carota subsp. sativus TaxID=79200 RepID=A0A175YQM3_DAUCS
MPAYGFDQIEIPVKPYWTAFYFSKESFPPGPRGLPILGNLLQIGPNPHQSLARLAKKYGPLMTIYQGSVTTIVASSAEMAQLILQKHDADMSGRIIPDAITTLEHPSHSMAWLHAGEEWRLIRRVLATFLTNTHKLDSLCELRHGVMELFLAGSETSTNTTEWAMTELILHPDKMTKLRNEIAESVSQKGRIEESELLRLPYLQAVVKETMRLHLAVPFLLPHKTETNVKLKGYEIPKNTQVLVNAWAIARDLDSWENPTSFMPERFLDSEVDFRGQHFSYLPFGSGRRMCPGIPLAHRVVSLMIASLVYHFEWKLPHDMNPKEHDMTERFGLTLARAVPLVAVPISL